jgi:hypothetical protein
MTSLVTQSTMQNAKLRHRSVSPNISFKADGFAAA